MKTESSSCGPSYGSNACGSNGCGANSCGYGCGTGCYSDGNTCNTCQTSCSYKVWVPNMVKQLVPYTVCETTCVEVPYEYNVTLCRPETRTRMVKTCSYAPEQRTCTVKVCGYVPEQRSCTVKVCEYTTEQRSREVPYFECVPVQKQGVREVCTYNCVPHSKVETYTVCVPVCVEKQVEVKRCRMVCQTVPVNNRQTCGTSGCATCGH